MNARWILSALALVVASFAFSQEPKSAAIDGGPTKSAVKSPKLPQTCDAARTGPCLITREKWDAAIGLQKKNLADITAMQVKLEEIQKAMTNDRALLASLISKIDSKPAPPANPLKEKSKMLSFSWHHGVTVAVLISLLIAFIIWMSRRNQPTDDAPSEVPSNEGSSATNYTPTPVRTQETAIAPAVSGGSVTKVKSENPPNTRPEEQYSREQAPMVVSTRKSVQPQPSITHEFLSAHRSLVDGGIKTFIASAEELPLVKHVNAILTEAMNQEPVGDIEGYLEKTWPAGQVQGVFCSKDRLHRVFGIEHWQAFLVYQSDRKFAFLFPKFGFGLKADTLRDFFTSDDPFSPISGCKVPAIIDLSKLDMSLWRENLDDFQRKEAILEKGLLYV